MHHFANIYNKSLLEDKERQKCQAEKSDSDESSSSSYEQKNNKKSGAPAGPRRRDPKAYSGKGFKDPGIEMPQNDSVGPNGMPLMVSLVMNTQVIKNAGLHEDYRSETGNSWNQSDIDEAYKQYYANMPASLKDSDESSERRPQPA